MTRRGSVTKRTDLLASKAAVDRRERVELVLERGLVLGVKEAARRTSGQDLARWVPEARRDVHLDDLGAVDVLPSALAGDLLQNGTTQATPQSALGFLSLRLSCLWRVAPPPLLHLRHPAEETATHGGVDEVLKDLLVDLLERARAGALLLDARDTGRLAHHAALADEDDVAVRELLLELASEAGLGCRTSARGSASARRGKDVPALDLVESLDLGDGDEDYNRLLATPAKSTASAPCLTRETVGRARLT